MFSYCPLMYYMTEVKEKMNESKGGAAETYGEKKKPQAVHQHFAVKDKVISTLPSGAFNTHDCIADSQTHRRVFLPVSKN